MKIIISILRETILMLYPLACLFLFSFLYPFVWFDFKLKGKDYSADFEVVEKININRSRCKKVGAFLYDPEVDGLYHDSPWWFPVQIGITHGLKTCQVTPMFLKLPFIMKGWINHDILLRMIELLHLVKENKILMHASCVDDTLIVGFPNAGKTYQTFKKVSEGGRLRSEEYTIIEEYDGVWTIRPYKDVMRTCFSKRTMDDCGLKRTWKENIWLFFSSIRAAIFPFMYEAVIWKEIPIKRYANDWKVGIKRIAYGSTGEEIRDWKKFAILCENEFPFMASEFLQAYALATGFDILAVQERQRQLIKMFVNSVYA